MFFIESFNRQLKAVISLTLIAFASLCLPAKAKADDVIYTVGSGPGCDYPGARQALVAAARDTHYLVYIEDSLEYDPSLSVSSGGSVVTISNASPYQIQLVGGYADCSSVVPTSGHYTTLDYGNATQDHQYTLLKIHNDAQRPRTYLGLSGIIMRGGSYAFDSGGPNQGGAVNLTGNATLELDHSAIDGFSANQGGGVYVEGWGNDRSRWPILRISADSDVRYNQARYGGGIYSKYGRVVLDGGTVEANVAEFDGGGLYLLGQQNSGDYTNDDNVALLLSNKYGAGQNVIHLNAADGLGDYSTGAGGGIYSMYGHIVFDGHPAGTPRFQNIVSDNSAERGGGIFVEGPNQGTGGPYTFVRIKDTEFSDNASTGFDGGEGVEGGGFDSYDAVDTTIDSSGGVCSLYFDGKPHPSPCSVFQDNHTGFDEGRSPAYGGAIFVMSTRTDGASRGIVRVYRTWFRHNADAEGGAAVATAGFGNGNDYGSVMVFHRDIFTDNQAGTASDFAGNSALIYSSNGKDLDFRYNTVLANDVSRMFYMNGGQLDAQGSILWGLANTRDNQFLYFSSYIGYFDNGATYFDNDCALLHNSAGLPSGGGTNDWIGWAPQLGADFAPGGGSSALDNCDSVYGYNPGPDAYGNGAYDVPGVPPRWAQYPPYNFDLGAVEQHDIIFANSFGDRPTN